MSAPNNPLTRSSCFIAYLMLACQAAAAAPAPDPKLPAGPQVVFEPAAMTIKQAREPHEYTLEITAPVNSKAAYSVRLSISPEGGPSISVPMKAAGKGVYHVTTALLLQPPSPDENPQSIAPFEIPFAIKVSEGGKVVANETGSFKIQNAAPAAVIAPSPGPGSPIPAPAKSEARIVKLPSPADDIVAGGSGRYLCIAMRRIKKVAIFDVIQGKIVRSITIPSDVFLIAAGAQKLLVFIPGQHLLQRWDLSSGERELTATLPDELQAQSLVMGWASTGPALLGNDKCINVATLEIMDVDVKSSPGAMPGDPLVIRAGGDGTTFGGWVKEQFFSDVFVASLVGNRLHWNSDHNPAGYAAPNYDGTVLFTALGPIRTDTLKIIIPDPNKIEENFCIPSYDANFYLVWKPPVPAPRTARNRTPTSPALTIYTAVHNSDEHRPLLALADVTEISGEYRLDNLAHSGITLDKRFHFLPAANVLVTLASSNDQLIIRTINVTDAMNKAGHDYFLVTSVPVHDAVRGSTYTYGIKAASNEGGVTFKLGSGPEGMSIDANGTLRWAVPRANIGPDVVVIVTLCNASGQEIYHTFKVALREPS